MRGSLWLNYLSILLLNALEAIHIDIELVSMLTLDNLVLVLLGLTLVVLREFI